MQYWSATDIPNLLEKGRKLAQHSSTSVTESYICAQFSKADFDKLFAEAK
jgi:hypothetical protein